MVVLPKLMGWLNRKGKEMVLARKHVQPKETKKEPNLGQIADAGVFTVNNGPTHCCGIRAIYSLGEYPDLNVCIPMKKDFEVFPPKILEQYKTTKGDLFILYIKKFLENASKSKAAGLIQVALAFGGKADEPEQEDWVPYVEKAGFVPVEKDFLNTNTGNTVTLYHLRYDFS